MATIPQPMEPTRATAAPAAQSARTDLPVQGMTCAACVRRVEKALCATPGVQEATVNLVTRRATVAYDAQATTPAALAHAIVEAGYEVPEVPEAGCWSSRRGPTASARSRRRATAANTRLDSGTFAGVIAVPALQAQHCNALQAAPDDAQRERRGAHQQLPPG